MGRFHKAAEKAQGYAKEAEDKGSPLAMNYKKIGDSFACVDKLCRDMKENLRTA